MKTVIIDYGAGNVQSVIFALKRLGYSAIVSSDEAIIKAADKVIFPGVGHATAAMKKITDKNLVNTIQNLKQPVLGICLGMQLMCKTTEEGNVKGLGIFDLNVKRFPETVKIPKIGWNELTNLKSVLFENIPKNSYVYFIHSYYVPLDKSTIATTNYGLDYAAAIQKDNFLGCQFHPEKSGDVGEQILQKFMKL